MPKNWFFANLVTALGLFLVFTVAAIAANALTLNKYVCVALGLGIGVTIGLKISKWYVLGGFVGLFFTLVAGSNIIFTDRESSSGLIVILFEFFGSVVFFFWKMKVFLDAVKKIIERSGPRLDQKGKKLQQVKSEELNNLAPPPERYASFTIYQQMTYRISNEEIEQYLQDFLFKSELVDSHRVLDCRAFKEYTILFRKKAPDTFISDKLHDVSEKIGVPIYYRDKDHFYCTLPY